MPQTATHITQLGRVFIPVSDQDKALAFYTDTLGFELRADIPFGEGDRWIEVGPPGGESAVALVTPMESNQPGGHTNVSFTTDDIDASYASLSERGVDCKDIMRMGDPVPPMFEFSDQDGNVFMLVERQG
jgi:catechol 2,3-dioxygenase-like lactoylglutathione lyase family enzyme